MMYLIYVIHVLACIWALLGYTVPGSWIFTIAKGKGEQVKQMFDPSIVSAVYVRSVYFIVTTLTTVGYGDFTGFTEKEYMF